MDVELLVVPDCPHEATARDLVRAALAELGVSASVTTTVVTDHDDALTRGFTGSPTFLVDGHDPFEVPNADVAITCRLYPTPAGLAGVPFARRASRGAASRAESLKEGHGPSSVLLAGTSRAYLVQGRPCLARIDPRTAMRSGASPQGRRPVILR